MTPTPRARHGPRKGGRPPLVGGDSERARRGWLRPGRARDVQRPPAEPTSDWLQGLSAEAALQGVFHLQYAVPSDRTAFRKYLVAFGALARFWRAAHKPHGPVTNADVAAMTARHDALRARVARLERRVIWRPRW
jgi:hypothetical protein